MLFRLDISGCYLLFWPAYYTSRVSDNQQGAWILFFPESSGIALLSAFGGFHRSQSCWWSGWGGSGLQARTTMVNPAVDVNSCSWLEVGLSTFPLNSWWRLLGYCWSCVILSILQSYTLFIFKKLVDLLHWWFNWESLSLTHSIEVLWLGKINGIFTFIIRGIQYPGSWYYKFMLPWWTLLMFSNYKFEYVNKFNSER